MQNSHIITVIQNIDAKMTKIMKHAEGVCNFPFHVRDEEFKLLGIANNERLARPEHVWITAAAIAFHKLYLLSDGRLFGMGYNRNGQLGTGDRTIRHTPIQINTNGAKITTIAVGLNHSIYLTEDNTLHGMGDNSDGQLGHNFTNSFECLTPVEIRTHMAKPDLYILARTQEMGGGKATPQNKHDDKIIDIKANKITTHYLTNSKMVFTLGPIDDGSMHYINDYDKNNCKFRINPPNLCTTLQERAGFPPPKYPPCM